MSTFEPEDVLFDDGKAPDALRTIGEVAKALGIRQHVLRYWEEQFTTLRPVKRSGGRRYYRPEDVALIARINRLVHHEGYTLRGAKSVIGQAGQGAGRQNGPRPNGHRPNGQGEFGSAAADTVSKLSAIRKDLAAALAAS